MVETVARTRPILLEARNRRPRPSLDDKVLTSWNGLMIAAAARAGRVIGAGDPERGAHWIARAARAAEFIRGRLWQPDSASLLRRWRDGHAGIEGYCEDYACFTWGLLELLQATGDARWLAWARETRRRRIGCSGTRTAPAGSIPPAAIRSVLLRLKEDYDGAEPAASSVSVREPDRATHLEPDEAATQRIARTLARLGPGARCTARAWCRSWR